MSVDLRVGSAGQLPVPRRSPRAPHPPRRLKQGRTLRHFSHSNNWPFSLRPTEPFTSPSSPSSIPTSPSAPPRPPFGRLLGRAPFEADSRRRASEVCEGRRVLPCEEDRGEFVGRGEVPEVGAMGIGVDCLGSGLVRLAGPGVAKFERTWAEVRRVP